MKVEKLIQLLKSNEIAGNLSLQERNELASLIHGLKRVEHLDLATLVKACHTIKLPKKRAASPRSSATVETSIARLNSLKEEVRKWTSPDYGEVDRVVKAACSSLKKSEVSQVAKATLGKTHSSKTKSDIIEAIARPYLRQLELRFMNAGS
tara:strand:- start:2499 stop:2951 length:453 start_codon:yes stop_codon:yes gene_type:complete